MKKLSEQLLELSQHTAAFENQPRLPMRRITRSSKRTFRRPGPE